MRWSRSALRDRRRERNRRQLVGGLRPSPAPAAAVIAAATAPLPVRKLRRCNHADHSPALLVAPLLHGSGAIGQQARSHVRIRLFQDGVKRPGTREMTVMLAGADGAQRLRDRRDDPGAARRSAARCTSRRRTTGSWSSSPISSASRSTQLLWGPLADRFGRKPILAAGVVLYGVFALLCGVRAAAFRC